MRKLDSVDRHSVFRHVSGQQELNGGGHENWFWIEFHAPAIRPHVAETSRKWFQAEQIAIVASVNRSARRFDRRRRPYQRRRSCSMICSTSSATRASRKPARMVVVLGTNLPTHACPCRCAHTSTAVVPDRFAAVMHFLALRSRGKSPMRYAMSPITSHLILRSSAHAITMAWAISCVV